MSLPTRKIGQDNVTAIGYGAMSLAGVMYSPSTLTSENDRLKVRRGQNSGCCTSCIIYICQVLDAAYAAGCKNWDTADVYNDAEELMGKW